MLHDCTRSCLHLSFYLHLPFDRSYLSSYLFTNLIGPEPDLLVIGPSIRTRWHLIRSIDSKEEVVSAALSVAQDRAPKIRRAALEDSRDQLVDVSTQLVGKCADASIFHDFPDTALVLARHLILEESGDGPHGIFRSYVCSIGWLVDVAPDVVDKSTLLSIVLRWVEKDTVTFQDPVVNARKVLTFFLRETYPWLDLVVDTCSIFDKAPDPLLSAVAIVAECGSCWLCSNAGQNIFNNSVFPRGCALVVRALTAAEARSVLCLVAQDLLQRSLCRRGLVCLSCNHRLDKGSVDI